MPTDVIMPQMGESIAEGTVLKWLKTVGESVERDEPLFEISTDKVDAEIPAPTAGILAAIKVGENETVPINTVVGLIAAPGEDVGEEAATSAPGESPATPPATPSATSAEPLTPTIDPASDPEQASIDRIRTRSSPLVRSIAEKENVDISQVSGSGIHGRVTKKDIMAFLEQRAAMPTTPPTAALPAASAGAAAAGTSAGGFILAANSMRPTELPALPPAHLADENVIREPLSPIRKRIAENMVMSRRLKRPRHHLL